MRIDIKLQPDTPLIDLDGLYETKVNIESYPLSVDGISFDVDSQSIERLDMISNIEGEINFREANNNTLTLSGTELQYYIPIIKNKLGVRFVAINEVYNNLKVSISAGEELTYANVLSSFEAVTGEVYSLLHN